MNPLWQAILLGWVQGLTEFLPVSSSAHLMLLPHLGGWQHLGKTFDVAVHGGTLVALGLYLRRDLWMLARAAGWTWQPAEPPAAMHLFRLLVWASLPAAVIGFLLEDFLESAFQSGGWVALWLALGALVMLWADRLRGSRVVWQLSSCEAVKIGLAQAVALMPGVSRSGATLVAGRSLGLTPSEAVRFSMLMAFPVIFGATAWKILKLLAHRPDEVLQWPVLAAGMASAAVSGLLALAVLAEQLPRWGLSRFAYYRLGLALVVLLAG